jgi:translocation and assembly module TamB
MEWSGARLDIEGGVRVRGTWDHPVMLGDVHMLDGNLIFQGTKYQISRGDIDFANPFRLDPNLNVEATTTIQQYLVTVSFSGTLSHLSLAYRSDPPLPTNDVIALLALGSTGEQNGLRSSGGQQSQNYGATALLSAAISNQLGGRVEQLFGISSFRVSPFLAGTTEQNAAARVTIEQQVTRQLTVTYSTNAQSNQQQAVQLEYALSPKVSLVALRDINGIYSVSVKFTKRLK